MLALIGNSKSSNALVAQHPKPNRLRQVLGLEAKNPAIVFDDANIDQAVKECVNGALSYNGQRCTALKLIFVHKSVSAEFRSKFTKAVDALVLDHPATDSTLTPLPERNKVEHMEAYVDDAVSKGARVINKKCRPRFRHRLLPGSIVSGDRRDGHLPRRAVRTRGAYRGIRRS